MLSVELLARMVEIVLGEVSKRLSREGSGAKRRFARVLLAQYEDLKDYRDAIEELRVLLERERSLVPSGRVTPGTAKQAAAISQRISSLTAQLTGRFQGELTAAVTGRGRIPRAEAARRRQSVLAIYDSQLAAMIDLANFDDTSVASIAARLAELNFDWESQVVTLFDPSVDEFPTTWLPSLNRALRVAAAEQVDDLEISFGPGFKTLDLTAKTDHERLIEFLRYNQTTVGRLIDKTASFLGGHFAIEDLL